MVSNDQRARLLRGLFENHYADRDHEVVSDTNRTWTSFTGSTAKSCSVFSGPVR